MARNSSVTYSTHVVEGHQCPDCGIILSHNSDMSRHRKTHSENRQAIVHRCPWVGCNFSSLQKSNMETHYNTHTGNKNKCCPDCDFKSVDPGSLTRHRKRKHGYVPRPRKRLGVVTPYSDSTTTTTTNTTITRTRHRHTPYPLPRSSSSSTSKSSASPITFIHSKYTAMSIDRSEQNDNERTISNLSELDSRFFWRPQDSGRIARSPSPRLILPAVDTGHHMREPNATFRPREEYTQTGQTQYPLPPAPIENWDFARVLDANNCSMALGQQFTPQYLGDGALGPNAGNGQASSPLNLGPEFDLALAATLQQQMPITGADSGSTNANVNSLSAAPYEDWTSFFAAVESPCSGSSSNASPVSIYSSYSSPYTHGYVDMALEGLTEPVIPVAPTSFAPAWQL